MKVLKNVHEMQLERARSELSTREGHALIESCFDLIHSASACGAPLTLNENQTRALSIHLEGIKAKSELQKMAVASAKPDQPGSNIIPFPRTAITPTTSKKK